MLNKLFSFGRKGKQEAPPAADEPPSAAPSPAAPPAPVSFLDRLKAGLAKTRALLTTPIEDLFVRHKALDDSFWEELEEVLLRADVGVACTTRLVEDLRTQAKERRIQDAAALTGLLKEDLALLLGDQPSALQVGDGLSVILVVGVNGSGKTTTIGKLAAQFRQAGRTVLLAAADTFRAAAIEQLEIWGRRAGAEVIKHREGSDPAAVVYDAVQAALARKVDLLIVDTAGRLHTKVNLMEELKKIRRVLDREAPGALREVLLVLDGTTGQNAIQQAKQFTQAVELTGLVITKLDGTAKGGAILAVHHEVGVPVKLIGVGEGVDDLRPFEAKPFLEALFARVDNLDLS